MNLRKLKYLVFHLIIMKQNYKRNSKSKYKKDRNTHRFKDKLLVNKQVIKKFGWPKSKILLLNGDENTAYQNVWDIMETGIRGKITVINA